MTPNIDVEGSFLFLYSCGLAQIIGIPCGVATGVMGCLAAPCFTIFGEPPKIEDLRKRVVYLKAQIENGNNKQSERDELWHKLDVAESSLSRAWTVKRYFLTSGFFIISMIPFGGGLLAKKIGVYPWFR